MSAPTEILAGTGWTGAERAAGQAETRSQLRGSTDDRRAWDEALAQAVGRWFGTPLPVNSPESAGSSRAAPGGALRTDSAQAAGLAALRSALLGASPPGAALDALGPAGQSSQEGDQVPSGLAGLAIASMEAGLDEEVEVGRSITDPLAKWNDLGEPLSQGRLASRDRLSSSAAETNALRQAPGAGGGDPAPREPVRWHAEWRENGLSLWVGVDGDPALQLTRLGHLLLQELRPQLEARGARLVSLVCNGRTLLPSGPRPSDGAASASAEAEAVPQMEKRHFPNPLNPKETP
jgi:hypothetical protein